MVIYIHVTFTKLKQIIPYKNKRGDYKYILKLYNCKTVQSQLQINSSSCLAWKGFGRKNKWVPVISQMIIAVIMPDCLDILGLLCISNIYAKYANNAVQSFVQVNYATDRQVMCNQCVELHPPGIAQRDGSLTKNW